MPSAALNLVHAAAWVTEAELLFEYAQLMRDDVLAAIAYGGSTPKDLIPRSSPDRLSISPEITAHIAGGLDRKQPRLRGR